MRLGARVRSLERLATDAGAMCAACGLHAHSPVIAVPPPVVARIAEGRWYTSVSLPPPCGTCGRRKVVAIPAPARARIGEESA